MNQLPVEPVLPALSLVTPSRAVRKVVMVFAALLLTVPVVLVLVPWRQNISASGRVAAVDLLRHQEPAAPTVKIQADAVGHGERAQTYGQPGEEVLAQDRMNSENHPGPDVFEEFLEDRQVQVRVESVGAFILYKIRFVTSVTYCLIGSFT